MVNMVIIASKILKGHMEREERNYLYVYPNKVTIKVLSKMVEDAILNSLFYFSDKNKTWQFM